MSEGGSVWILDELEVVLRYAGGVRAPGVETVRCRHRWAGCWRRMRADRDQPPFDRSTRDGFAVRAGDLAGGGLVAGGGSGAGGRGCGGGGAG